MGYKAQIEWLKKNHFAFNVYDYTKTSENQKSEDGNDFKINENINFVIQTGDSHIPISINNEIFVSKEDAEKKRIPEKIVQKINFGGKEFTNTKTREFHDTRKWENINTVRVYEKYENDGNLPKGLSKMIDRIVEKRYSSSDYFLKGKDYEEYQERVDSLLPKTRSYDDEKDNVLAGLEAIKKDFIEYGAIDKELVKDFLEEEIETLKSLAPEGSQNDEIKEAAKLLRKLIYRNEDALDNTDIFSEIETNITQSFEKITEASVIDVTIDEKMSVYREMQIKKSKKYLEDKLLVHKGKLASLESEVEDKEDFLLKFTKVYNQRSKDKSRTPDELKEDQNKIKFFRKGILVNKVDIANEEANISNIEACLQDMDAFLDGKICTRMRLVPPVIFDMIMDSQPNGLEGMERKKQADLNQALLNTSNPQGFINLLQKFSGEEQASIVYFGMNNDSEKIDSMIQAHEQRRYEANSEYVA